MTERKLSEKEILDYAARAGLEIVGKVIKRDKAYLDAPNWVIIALQQLGYIVEEPVVIPKKFAVLTSLKNFRGHNPFAL